MLVYYILLSVLSLTGIYAGKKHAKQSTILYLSFSALILTLAASFRYAIGFDYFSYRNIYENMESLSFYEILYIYKTEFMFYIFCKLLVTAGVSYIGFLFIVSLFMHGTAMWAVYRYSKMPWLSVYLYITLQFFAHNMNLIRQSIALSFFLFAYPFLKKRKFLLFLLIMVCGTFFHNSLIFMVPLYFLLPIKANVKSLSVFFGFTICMYVLYEPFFLLISPLLINGYGNYVYSIFWQPSTADYIIFPAVFFFLLFLFRKKYASLGRDASIYLNSAFFTAAIKLFITKHFILERFSVYPHILLIFAIPDVIYCIHNREETKKMPVWHRKACYVLALFFVLGGLNFLFSAHKGIHHVYPYVSLLDKAKSSVN